MVISRRDLVDCRAFNTLKRPVQCLRLRSDLKFKKFEFKFERRSEAGIHHVR